MECNTEKYIRQARRHDLGSSIPNAEMTNFRTDFDGSDKKENRFSGSFSRRSHGEARESRFILPFSPETPSERAFSEASRYPPHVRVSQLSRGSWAQLPASGARS